MENLKQIKIKIVYEGSLKDITEKDCEEAIISRGLEFVNFLGFIFSSHPGIEQTFPPGTLGILLNNKPPQTREILKNGDIVRLSPAV